MVNLNFWADIVTIISIFVALFIFISDKCEKSLKKKSEYVNKLNALKFELMKNHRVILGFFRRDMKNFLDGKKIAYYSYSDDIIKSLIVNGSIQDKKRIRDASLLL